MNGKITAIILAAGQGKRMKSSVQKQFLMLKEKPILFYALNAFAESSVDEIVLVTGREEIGYCMDEIVKKYHIPKVKAVVAGGKERYDSVYAGLIAAKEAEYVLIHDGARPFVTRDIIERNIRCVFETKACVTAVPSKDTVKIASADGFVSETPDRSRVWCIQTPQTFEYQLVMAAYEKQHLLEDQSITDDAMVVEKYSNNSIKLVMGDYKNIKITTPEDLIIGQDFV